jgi:hypothetical protein
VSKLREIFYHYVENEEIPISEPEHSGPWELNYNQTASTNTTPINTTTDTTHGDSAFMLCERLAALHF